MHSSAVVRALLSHIGDIGKAVVAEVTGGTKRQVARKLEGKRKGEASVKVVVQSSIEGTTVD